MMKKAIRINKKGRSSFYGKMPFRLKDDSFDKYIQPYLVRAMNGLIYTQQYLRDECLKLGAKADVSLVINNDSEVSGFTLIINIDNFHREWPNIPISHLLESWAIRFYVMRDIKKEFRYAYS